MIRISENFIRENFSPADFLKSCREAFAIYGSDPSSSPPKTQRVEKYEGRLDRFTLEMHAKMPGCSGYKKIDEQSDVSTGRLESRTAVIKLFPDGREEAEIEADYITNMRTGAAGVIGMEFFAPAARNVAILGTGKIANALARCASEAGIRKIYAYSRTVEKREQFKKDLEEAGIKVILRESVDECVEGCDAVLAAVPTPEPILYARHLRPPYYISCMGGDPRTSQLDAEILKDLNTYIVIDNEDQCRESGEFKRALETGYYQEIRGNFATYEGRVATIGDAALGRLFSPKDSTVICYFTGMGIQDMHAANMVYEEFMRRQI